MLTVRILLLSLFLVAPASTPSPTALPNPDVDVRRYTFRLTLSDDTDAIRGEATLAVRFLAGVDALHLDLAGPARGGAGMTVTAVRSDGADAPFTHENDRLTIRLEPPAAPDERRTFTIAYEGVPDDGLIISENKFGDRTFFGDNWPDRAHHWLPTVDHPSDKAICEFIVTAPVHYQVVGCGERLEETDLPGELRRTRWRSTVPMATKVMVIGAARFAVARVDEVEGVPVETWVYPQDRDPGFYDYALAERILRFFSGHIGPYPYAKLANVQSKTRFGGMENASNIFYAEGSVTGTRQSEGLLAHEIAHQWFGDSVTEQDWPHIWLSEGFATYFTQLYMEFTYGHDRLVAGMRTARDRVLAYARRAPNSPVVDPSITNLMALLSPNAYQKGAWVLHMLRHEVGDDVFWDGIRDYYRRYRDGNARTEDFRRVMEEASGRDLAWFFRQWIHRPGQPHFEGSWRYADGSLTITLRQTQPGPPFRLALEAGIYTGDALLPRIEALDVDDSEETFTLPLDAAPSRVVLDPNTWALMTADFSEE